MVKRTLALLMVVLSISVVLAQDEAVPMCPSDTVDEASAVLEDWAARLSEGTEDPLSVIMEMRDTSAQFAATCTGLRFDSDTEGISPVIGPLVVPAGIYRVIIEGEERDVIGVEQTVLGEDCGRDRMIVSKGSDLNISEAVHTVEADCEILLEITYASKPWVLTFEKIR